MDSDAVYRELGRAIVVFQGLDNQLRLIASFALSPETSGHAVAQAQNPWFARLVDLTEQLVSDFAEQHGGPLAAEFLAQFPNIFDRCRELGKRRNRMIHSAYLHIEAGGELLTILRSDSRVAPDGTLQLDQEPLSESSFDLFMRDVAETYFALGIIHRQLLFWYRPDAQQQ